MAGHQPTLSTGRLSTPHAELIPTDAHLGVRGRPQSATGQAAILTGINASQRSGEHYGPRPDARVRAVLDEGSIFQQLRMAGLRGYFCNAYPQGYFDAVNRGNVCSAPCLMPPLSAAKTLLNAEDLYAAGVGRGFTNAGWRTHLGYADVPVYTPAEGGQLLWRIAQDYAFVFFEHWYTDTLGHQRDLAEAVANFQRFDGFLAGLLAVADLENTLIIVSSDHGNVEDRSHGKHTENPALTLLLGAERQHYAEKIRSLVDFVPVIEDFLGIKLV